MCHHIIRSNILRGLSILSVIVLLFLSGCQQTNPGHAKTTSVVEVVQAAVAQELNMEVSLNVETLRQNDEWAFVSGVPLTAAGQPVDYSRTKFADAIREGYFDDGFVALAKRKREGVDDWQLTALSLGATDAPFVSWPEQFGAPRELVMP